MPYRFLCRLLGIGLLFVAALPHPRANARQSHQVDLVQQSRPQARSYISNIQRGQNVEENIWALAALAGAKQELNSYISSYLSSESPDDPLLATFRDTSLSYRDRLRDTAMKLRSPALLVAYFLEEDDSLRKEAVFTQFPFQELSAGDNHRQVARSLLDGTPISQEILPFENISLLHFLLTYYTAGRKILPSDYMEALASYALGQQAVGSSLPHTLRVMAVFHANYRLMRNSRAQEIYSLLADISHFPNSRYKMYSFYYLDYALYQSGNTDLSLEVMRTYTLPLASYLGRPDLQLSMNINRGGYLFEIGKIQEAQQAYQQVIASAEELGYAVPQSIIYNNLAITYLKMGDFDQYLDLQFQALNSIDRGGDYENHFTILENLFIHYRNTQNFESALNYLAEARRLAAEFGAMDDLAWVNLYTGIAYRDYQENYTLAEAYMNSASSQVYAAENYDRRQTIYAERGHLYVDQGLHEQALAMQDSIIAGALQVGDQPDLLEAYITKARIYLEQDKTEEAGRYVARYDTMDLSVLNFEQIVEARTVKSQHLYETGRPDEAYDLLEPTMEQLVDWVRGSTELQTGYWNLAPEFTDAFRLAANLLIDTGRQSEAVEVLDQLKSINDASLYQNPLVRSSILSESELTEYKQLSSRLNGLRRSLLAAADTNRSRIQQRIDELSAQKQRLDRRLSTLTNHDPVSVNDVQSRLSAREQVLHITELEDQYYVARISRRDVSFSTVPLDSANRALFRQSVDQIANKNTDLHNLYRISELMGFDELDPTLERLTVIPDSYLYQVPLDVLPVTPPEFSYSYGGASYLIEQVEVRYLTSLNDYRESERPAPANRSGYAGYGISTFENYHEHGLVPLPYARREVEGISGMLTNLKNRSVYLDSTSTEKRFKATAPHARILHLATHSQVSDQNPLFSRIFMSRTDTASAEEQFPGQIFAYELFELNLNNELIMLNSCESGSGGYLQGSGVVGISRALRYAGAETLVLNLWSVNDMMASDFALQFYKGLNKGMSKPEALREAKLHFLMNKNANPHFWGPYMMLGSSKPAVRPYQQWNYVVAGSFMLYFLLFVGGSLYYRRRSGDSQ